MVDTLAETFSIISAFTASLFLFSVWMIKDISHEFYVTMFFIFHLFWLLVSFPYLIATPFDTEDISINFIISVAILSIVNVYLINDISQLFVNLKFNYTTYFFVESSPFIGLIIGKMIKFIRDHGYAGKSIQMQI